MTPRDIKAPHDPFFGRLVELLGIRRFALLGLAWSVAVDLGGYLVLRALGMGAVYIHDDPTLRGIARAYRILIDIGGPPTIWALYAWLRVATGHLIEDLDRQGVLLEPSVQDDAVERATGALEWLQRYAWLVGLAVAGIGAFQHLVDPPGWNASSALLAQLRLTASIPLWYVLWMCVAAASVTAGSLRATFARYPVQIHVFHPDDHGGFGPLRRFIGTLIAYMLAISALLAAAVALATITSQISGDRLDPVLVVYVAGFLVIAPAMLLTIIWPAHEAMVQARARFADAAAALVASTPRQRPAPVTSADLDRIRAARQVSEILHAHPVWPFNPSGLRRAIAGILSPLFVGLLLDIVIRRLLR